MGVRRAVNMVLELVDEPGGPIWTLGPLIHNPQVVELFRQRGVVAAESLDEISRGMVVIRSHGISPELRRQLEAKGLRIIDATCPRVAHVHRIVEKHAGQGALIIILGDPGHSEVEGILGFAGEKSAVIQSVEEVESLPEAGRVVLVAQTTQSQNRFEQVAEAVRKRYCGLDPELVQIVNTICDSTERKQNEIGELAREVDALVIVGGRQSANTRRLKEIAESYDLLASLVESEDELDFSALLGAKKVGLTAGASTPNWMIRRVYEELNRLSLADRRFPLRVFYQALRYLGILNIYLGLGGALLTALAGILVSGEINLFAAFASFFYLGSIHNFNMLAKPELLAVIEPARGKFFLGHRRALLLLSMIGLVLGGVFAALTNPWALLFYAGLCILGLLYQARFRQKGPIFKFRSLMDIPGSKDLFSALAWSVMIVLVPLAGKPEAHVQFKPWLMFGLIFLMVIARSIVQDFRDLQADRLAGKETVPTLLGPAGSRALVHLIMGLAVLVLSASLWLRLFPPAGLGLLLGLFWLWLCVPFFTSRPIIQGLRAELLIDFSFILAGIAGLGLKII